MESAYMGVYRSFRDVRSVNVLSVRIYANKTNNSPVHPRNSEVAPRAFR